MIIQDYSENIDKFRQLRMEKLTSIGDIQGKENILFKKILYLTFLDSLSSIVYPKEHNKVRFVSLVNRFSKWESRDLSLIHISEPTRPY